MRSKGQRRSRGAPREQRRTPKPRVTDRFRTNPKAARKAFQERYPDIVVDSQLFRLVGVDPPLRLETERDVLREAITNSFATKHTHV